MGKDIAIKVNIINKKKQEELLAQVIAEIATARINKIPKEDRKYVLDRILKDLSNR